MSLKGLLLNSTLNTLNSQLGSDFSHLLRSPTPRRGGEEEVECLPEAILIRVGDVELDAELNDSETARKIFAALPLESEFNTWGDEIYFEVPVSAGPEDPKETVSQGELGYWPPGKAFCIFYGKTPASRGEEIRPASPVNPIGRVLGDATQLKETSEDRVIIEAV